jgi:hypothetical protein
MWITPAFAARLRERLSPQTWALEWLALGVALLGLLSPLWPMSMREQLVADGLHADAVIERVTRFNQRNQRWGTTKKIGATLPVYLLDMRWTDERGRRIAITAFHVNESDAVKLGLDRAPGGERTLPIRYFLPPAAADEANEGRAMAVSSDVPTPCYPEAQCQLVLLEGVHTFDAKKFGDRPESGLTLVGLLVFLAMLGVRTVGLVLMG